MGKIATEQEAATIGGKVSPSTKCCTKTRAESLGCKVNGDYTSNQLLQLSDLSQDFKRITLKWTARTDYF